MPSHHPRFPTTVGVDLTDFSPASLSQCWKEHQCRVGPDHRAGHTCPLTEAGKLYVPCALLSWAHKEEEHSAHILASVPQRIFQRYFLPVDSTVPFLVRYPGHRSNWILSSAQKPLEGQDMWHLQSQLEEVHWFQRLNI